MSQTLQGACASIGGLAQQAASQINQEVAQDPLFTISLEKLKNMTYALDRVDKKLRKESDMFSVDGDLSKYELVELTTAASDIREASRKLAIVLASGANQFGGTVKADIVTISELKPYLDPIIAEDLDCDALGQVVKDSSGAQGMCAHGRNFYHCPYGCLNQSQQGLCAHGHHRHQCPYGCQNQGQQVKLTGDFTQGLTVAETFQKLAQHLSELAEQVKDKHKDFEASGAQKHDKEKEQKKLVARIRELVPLLRSHVLRVGIAKGKHLNISNGCANVSTITNMFDYATVENAHRELEDCRDRVIQELTMRKLEERMNDRHPNKRSKIAEST